jgi:hypothetical protein
VFVIAVAGMLWLSRAFACPFCLSPPQTFAEQMSRADVVLIAELVRFEVLDFGRRAESTMRIRKYLRGARLAAGCRQLDPGQVLKVDHDFSGQPGDLFLMYGDLAEADPFAGTSTFRSDDQTTGPGTSATQNDPAPVTVRSGSAPVLIEKPSILVPEELLWNDTTAISAAAADYLQALPASDLPPAERLPFYLDYLEHPDPALAIDAWAEFANSTYAEVVSVREHFPRDRLRTWIADPQASPDRLGLYGMMLGLCGDATDMAFLKEQLGNPLDPSYRFGSDGLMGGYLLLGGAEGLTQLEDRCITGSAATDETRFALMQALSFMHSYEPDMIDTRRLRQSMRMFVQYESVRELAITHLARWQDWELMPRLITLHHEGCADDPGTRNAIELFADVCAKANFMPDGPAAAASTSTTVQTVSSERLLNPFAEVAADFLSGLEVQRDETSGLQP